MDPKIVERFAKLLPSRFNEPLGGIEALDDCYERHSEEFNFRINEDILSLLELYRSLTMSLSPKAFQVRVALIDMVPEFVLDMVEECALQHIPGTSIIN